MSEEAEVGRGRGGRVGKEGEEDARLIQFHSRQRYLPSSARSERTQGRAG